VDQSLGSGCHRTQSKRMLQARRSWVKVPMRQLNCFILPLPSSHAMALLFTQPLTDKNASSAVCERTV
jgi:hypothetical protein